MAKKKSQISGQAAGPSKLQQRSAKTKKAPYSGAVARAKSFGNLLTPGNPFGK